jgi:hypothetical protein
MSIADAMKLHITVTDDVGNTYEAVADLTRTTKNEPSVKKAQKIKAPTTIIGPAGAIKKLYYENFFKTEKSLEQVMSKLGDKGVNFDVRLVSMALYRAKYLTKKGTRGSYTYIQKHPPS